MRRILRALHTVGHRYRASEEMRAWRARDPVSRFQRWLLGQGWWSEGQDAELRQACRKEVSALAAWQIACAGASQSLACARSLLSVEGSAGTDVLPVEARGSLRAPATASPWALALWGAVVLGCEGNA